MGARDGDQLGVEHTGEGEQVIALVLQRDTHRADASRVLGLAGQQLPSPWSRIKPTVNPRYRGRFASACVARSAVESDKDGTLSDRLTFPCARVLPMAFQSA